MSVSQQHLFLDLEALTEEQIEAGLRAGVWGDPSRPVVERYLDQMKLLRVEAVATEQLNAAQDAIAAAQEALAEARSVKAWALSALIVAGGAMAAAMGAALIAFLALRNWTIAF
jgi:hypothetical protein